MKKIIINFLSTIVLCSSSLKLFDKPFDGHLFYIIVIIVIPFIIPFNNITIDKKTVKFLIYLLISNIVCIILNNNTIQNFIKIFVGTSLMFSFYYYWLRYNKFNFILVFKYYYILCIFIVFIGFFQLFSYFLGFKMGYDYSWFLNNWSSYADEGGVPIRINSILTEPSHYVMLLSPALFYSIKNLTNNNRKVSISICLFLLTGYLMSVSSLGFISIGIMLIYISFKHIQIRKIFFGIILLLFSIKIAYETIPPFTQRVNSFDTLLKIDSFEALNIKDVDLSTFTLFNNLYVVGNVISKSPLIGNGLGSHPVSYEKYSLVQTLIDSNYIESNMADANSYILRITSELGIIGLFLFVSFYLKIMIKTKKNEEENQIIWINHSCIFGMIPFLIRGGHYFLYGFPLFLWIAYLSYQKDRNKNVESITHN